MPLAKIIISAEILIDKPLSFKTDKILVGPSSSNKEFKYLCG